MRALLALPVLALGLGFLSGTGVHLTPDLIPVAVVVVLSYAVLGLVEVVPEAIQERVEERRTLAERRWAAARVPVTRRY